MKILTALLIPALFGYLLISLAGGGGKRSGFLERLALGFGMGAGLIAFEIFIAGLCGVPFTLLYISLPILLGFLILLAARYIMPVKESMQTGPSGLSTKRDTLKTVLGAALIVWISGKALFVLYGGLYFPIVSQDAWWNWSGAAKFFFYSKGFVLDPSNEHFFGIGYRPFLGYPLLNPLTQLWTALVLGDFHEALVKAFSPIYYISTLAIVFFTVKREGGFYAGLLTAFFLSAAPLMTHHAMDAYSDLPLAFYVLSGSVFLWRYMEEGGVSKAALSGLLFAMAAFTKNEGLVYLAAGLIALTAFNALEKRREWKNLFYFAIPAALYIGPWILFKAWYGIGYGHGTGVGVGATDISGGIVMTGRLHLEVIPLFFKEIFFTINHGLLFPFLALVSILGIKTLMRSNIKYLLFIILFVSAVLLVDYAATSDFIHVINRTAVNRNALAFLPLGFLVAGLLTSRILRGFNKKEV